MSNITVIGVQRLTNCALTSVDLWKRQRAGKVELLGFKP